MNPNATDSMESKNAKLQQLAADVLRLSRNTLLVNLRFLDAALSRLEPLTHPEMSYATDGHYLIYQPRHVLSCYRSDRAIPIRDYLHIVMHCVFRHMFVHTLIDQVAWDLACDIAVESTINGLGLRATAAGWERQQSAKMKELEKALGPLTAEKLYRYFLDHGWTTEKMADLRGLFYADNHRIWYMTDQEKASQGFPTSSAGSGAKKEDGSGGTGLALCSEADWKSISQRMQIDMETFSKGQGTDPGTMLQNLREVNREKYDYTGFLKKFAVRGEVMKINDEEFDYIYYTYGLQLYKNVPMIEPLEYKEVKRIREFVIAIDTSGSVAGEQVQSFLQKTYNILMSTESFFSKINLHIIQCDAAIQEDRIIHSQQEFDEYLKEMKLHGFGGTDFRPVFDYVEVLRKNKLFRNLKGLFYFTDGWGTFPAKKPDYETAFVFVDDGQNNYEVPPWAIKLVLQKEELSTGAPTDTLHSKRKKRMNIQQAKDQIKNAMTAYFTKDTFGNYVIPIERQRPVFLMGPPGIGKTAIMEQIAQELGVALVSYSMTHHTRQSALGLPFIETKTYGGKEYRVSEYTMSEIIAACYDKSEATGLREGILFLDEINCVSETLAPSMLQFLQYKTFGSHRVPEGWIVVTAGNPPEYNDSVHDFDIVTWDRLKRIDVEPDYEVWKRYAYKSNVHPAITTYLDIKKADFYIIETTVDGKSFVTARGWSDLSEMIRLYERHGIKTDESLISQYLQNRRIAKDFAIYYDLFKKYRADYQIDRILAGEPVEVIKGRARAARFDERLSLLGLLLDAVTGELRAVCNQEAALLELLSALKSARQELARPGVSAAAVVEKQITQRRTELETGKQAGTLSADELFAKQSTLAALEQEREGVIRKAPSDGRAAFGILKADFDQRVALMKKQAEEAGRKLSNMFRFCEDVFSEGQELVILVTELTISYYASRFISRYGCEEYFRHNKELLFYERQKEIIAELEKLEL